MKRQTSGRPARLPGAGQRPGGADRAHLRRRPFRGVMVQTMDDVIDLVRRQPGRGRARRRVGTASPSAWRPTTPSAAGRRWQACCAKWTQILARHGGLGRASAPSAWANRSKIPGTTSAPRLAHVHMKDASRREDGSWELKLMGERRSLPAARSCACSRPRAMTATSAPSGRRHGIRARLLSNRWHEIPDLTSFAPKSGLHPNQRTA